MQVVVILDSKVPSINSYTKTDHDDTGRAIHKNYRINTKIPDAIIRARVAAFMYAYVCMVTHIARVRINRVRLPILLVIS